MYRPSDFDHWTDWLLYEGREWSPWELARKVAWFVRRVWIYRRLLWHDSDWDYAYLLDLMALKLRRMADHFDRHALVVNAERMARECRVAAALCRRLRDDDYQREPITQASVLDAEQRKQADLDYLTHLMRRKLLCWWD